MFAVQSTVDGGLFDEFRRIEQEMDELLGRWSWPAGIRAGARGSYPPMNLGATPEKVEVYLFAAGLDPKALDISIQQNLLTVSGERKLPVQQDVDWYRQERFDGSFRRVISLPEDVDPNKVSAQYKDGVLQISVDRRKAAQPRQIQVN
jgi:HSP20 family protein